MSDRLSVSDIAIGGTVVAVKKLKPNFTVGADDMPTFILKGCIDALAPALQHIYSLPLYTGVFPVAWKQ